jgi:hypothetical protein
VSWEIPFAYPSLARDLSRDGAIKRSLSRNANIASPTSYSDHPPSPRTKLADSNRHTDPDLWVTCASARPSSPAKWPHTALPCWFSSTQKGIDRAELNINSKGESPHICQRDVSPIFQIVVSHQTSVEVAEATSRQPLGHGAALCARNGPEGSGPRLFFQVVVSHQTSVDVPKATSRQPVGHGARLCVRNGPESFGPLTLCSTGGWLVAQPAKNTQQTSNKNAPVTRSATRLRQALFNAVSASAGHLFLSR